MKTSSYKKTNTDTAQTAIKVLSNRNRFALMRLLLSSDHDMCVHEISENLGISQPATSHQLTFLEAYGVVESVRTGKTKCYMPTDAALTKKIKRVIKSLS